MRFFSIRECCGRVFERKKVLIVFSILILAGFILGIACIGAPAIYEYHLTACDRFIDRICFSERSVIVIFFERTAGNALWLVLFLLAGVHPIGLALPPVMFLFRAYTCGGSVAIFCSVYGFSGVLIGIILYLPIHTLIDCCLLAATSFSCSRARRFRFCGADFCELARDFLILMIFVAIVCFIEMLMLLVFFHPLGGMM